MKLTKFPLLQLPFVLLFTCIIFTPVPAAAQLEEVIVTAQKREQSQMDVPISISALTSDQFDVFDVTRSDDLETVFANIGTNRNSSGNSGFSIRGVGTDNVHLSGQQSVGVYVDDVSMVSGYVGSISIFDVERVEILRGPQNTLYGRNTTGGAVVWHTNKATPGEGTNGYVRMRAGNGGLMRVEAAVGFDFSENVAGRIAVLTDEFDGVWTNLVDGSDTGGAYDRAGGRFNLVWNNGDNARVGLTISTGEADTEDITMRASGDRLANGELDPNFVNRTADRLTGTDNNYVRATAADIAANPFLQDQYNRGTGMVIDNPVPGPFNRLVNFSTPVGYTYQSPDDGSYVDWDNIRLDIEYDFENFKLTSLTSFDNIHVLETNRQELTGFSPAREGDWDTFQQEIRLTSTTDGPVQWLAGLYYTDSDSTEDTWVAATGGAGGMGVSPGIDINSTYEATSLYGQVDWDVNDALTLSAGLRFTDDELSAANGNWIRTVCGFYPSSEGLIEKTREFRAAGCPGGVRLTGNTDSPVQKLSETGWKISGSYKTGEDSMFWASASEGFKGGSYDNRALSTGDDPIGPEFLTALEFGYKGTFANNTVQLSTSVYFYDWEDLQLFESYGGIPALVNVPGVDISGVEVELRWAPNDRWYIQGSIGTTDSEVVDVTGLDDRSLAEIGKEVTNTPDLTANLLGAYTIPMGDNELTLMMNYRYQSSMYYTFAQDSARDESSDYSFINARASYSFGDQQQYMLAVWGNNLTGEYACSRVIWGPSSAQNYSCFVSAYGEALYGLTFEVKFGNN